MQQLVFGWLLLTIGNSPFWLGLGGAAYAVAMITMGPVGGVVADAWDRRRSMQLTQVTALSINVFVALLLWLGHLQVWHLLLAQLLMGVSFTLNMPARQSMMAEIVPRRLLHNATAVHTAGMNFSRLVGPASAGALMAALGPLPVLLINLAGNTWTISQLARVRYRPAGPPKTLRLDFSTLAEGFRYCWQERSLLQIMAVISITNFFGVSYVHLLPALARDVLRVGPDGLGVCTSAMGGGALLGSLVLARRSGIPRKELLLSVSAILLGLLLALLGRVDGLLPAAVLLALIGAATSSFTAISLGAIQERIPDKLSGRVFGVYMLTNGLMPLGSLPAGILAAEMGTASTISLWGLLCALLSAVFLATRLVAARRPGCLRSKVSGLGSSHQRPGS